MGLNMDNSPVREHQYVVKNSFIHIVDEADEFSLHRPRAVSEFTGTRMAVHDVTEVPQTLPPLRPNAEDDVEESPSPYFRPSEASTDTARRGMSSSSLGQVSDGDTRTTVMMRNIPNAYTSDSFVDLFDSNGFWGRYNFVYLPIDFRTGVNLGYAFVNFVSHQDADLFKAHFNGFCEWFCQSPKVCEVTWTDPHQGLEEHIERYRNSPVMHEDVSDIYKPRLYSGGQRITFPAPTKRIRAPRVRPQKWRPPREHEDTRISLLQLIDGIH
eukprot:gnl/MRDRNA2_/MRDRNA2_114128_c0_seq1.p1 gnl/MRDRNA2_/MRDRNA2_114128_c0~~gnl/MRDRNA2_/MRDRNA2_114128_c0_seq1.p1  ORF type:complete len:269 (+),score=25.97 gnl/MRDRNA2_/MRDRNA2_114128_c0_seq1:185-991(+)